MKTFRWTFPQPGDGRMRPLVLSTIRHGLFALATTALFGVGLVMLKAAMMGNLAIGLFALEPTFPRQETAAWIRHTSVHGYTLLGAGGVTLVLWIGSSWCRKRGRPLPKLAVGLLLLGFALWAASRYPVDDPSDPLERAWEKLEAQRRLR